MWGRAAWANRLHELGLALGCLCRLFMMLPLPYVQVLKELSSLPLLEEVGMGSLKQPWNSMSCLTCGPVRLSTIAAIPRHLSSACQLRSRGHVHEC